MQFFQGLPINIGSKKEEKERGLQEAEETFWKGKAFLLVLTSDANIGSANVGPFPSFCFMGRRGGGGMGGQSYSWRPQREKEKK